MIHDDTTATRELGTESESTSSITSSQSIEPTAIGPRFGRYAILEELGRGAMGQVWRAYDPKLEREVALKVLRANVLDPDAQARLVREARAMAKLSHPNVVLVYDVNDSQSGVMLVMECIRGPTLRGWLKHKERTWEQRLARFAEAGRGLVAAHAVGLLHRDFKPSNVLIAEGDVAKVTDFGLAKLGHEEDSENTALPETTKDSLRGTLTAHNVIMGTPRYMAPEQHRGDTLSPQVDQYAFCVSLWEALAESPPFVGDYKELEARKHQGPPIWPEAHPVPRRVVDALRRGLAVDPAERWPSLSDLLEVLGEDRTLPRRAWLMAGGSLGLGVMFAAGWVQATSEQCTGASAQLQGVWDETRRHTVEAAVLGTNASFAADVWQRAGAELDEYAQQWAAMYTDACEATAVRKEQSETMMDLRVACMQRSRQQLEAVADVLEDADVEVVQKALQLVDGLEPLAGCADLVALQSGIQPPSSEDAEAVEGVRQIIARAKAQHRAGRVLNAKRSVEEAEVAAKGIDYKPLMSELALTQGDILNAINECEAAEDAYRTVLRLGIKSGQQRWVQSAIVSLISNVGRDQARPDEGLSFVDIAQGFIDDDPKALSDLHDQIASVYEFQGKYKETTVELRRAIALREEAFGLRHRSTLAAYINLAGSLMHQGHYEEAEQTARKALVLSTELLGPHHPLVANMHSTLGNVKHHQDDQPEAEHEHRQALNIWRDALGPDHFNVGVAHSGLGSALGLQGRDTEADAELYQALRIWEKNLAPGHPNLGIAHHNIGLSLLHQNKLGPAEQKFREALKIWSASFDPTHPNIALVHDNIGGVLRKQGRFDEALKHYRLALVVHEELSDPNHRAANTLRLKMALLLKEQHQYEEAKAGLIDLLSTIEAGEGLEYKDMALGHEQLGLIFSIQGAHQQAVDHLRRALALASPEQEDGAVQTASVRRELASALLSGGNAIEALPLAQQAWAQGQEEETSVDTQAEAAFTLAQVLWAIGDERRRAVELARQAATLYREHGAPSHDKAAQVQRWLRQKKAPKK